MTDSNIEPKPCAFNEVLHDHHDGCPACPCFCSWRGCMHPFHRQSPVSQRNLLIKWLVHDIKWRGNKHGELLLRNIGDTIR